MHLFSLDGQEQRPMAAMDIHKQIKKATIKLRMPSIKKYGAMDFLKRRKNGSWLHLECLL